MITDLQIMNLTKFIIPILFIIYEVILIKFMNDKNSIFKCDDFWDFLRANFFGVIMLFIASFVLSTIVLLFIDTPKIFVILILVIGIKYLLYKIFKKRGKK